MSRPRQAAFKRSIPRTASRRGKWRALALAAGLIAAAALVLPALLDHLGEQDRDLRALSPAETQAIHPLLIDASVGGNWPSLLVGELDAARWAELDAGRRSTETQRLIGALRTRGVENALLYANGTLAVNIVAGEAQLTR